MNSFYEALKQMPGGFPSEQWNGAAATFNGAVWKQIIETIPPEVQLEFSDVAPSSSPEFYLLFSRSIGNPASMTQCLQAFLRNDPVALSGCHLPFSVRLLEPNRSIILVESSGSVTYHGAYDRIAPNCALIYPRAGLFSNVVETALYPDVVETTFDQQLKGTVESAIQALARWDESLTRDMGETLSVIALTPDFGHPTRWSFSLRLQYFGGVFINAYRGGVLGVAESLMHEYMHQRIWLYLALSDILPDRFDHEFIISPVTQRQRGVRVMFHAFFIYISAWHFHRHMNRTPQPRITSQELLASRERQVQLDSAIPELHSSLVDVLMEAPLAVELLNNAYARWTAHRKP